MIQLISSILNSQLKLLFHNFPTNPTKEGRRREDRQREENDKDWWREERDNNLTEMIKEL